MHVRIHRQPPIPTPIDQVVIELLPEEAQLLRKALRSINPTHIPLAWVLVVSTLIGDLERVDDRVDDCRPKACSW